MLRIKNWNECFENNRTRELKSLAWVPLPNKHDGDGYTDLLDHENGAAHFGAWVALLQVASKCDPRGTLVRDSAAPHCSRSLSRMTRIPEAIMSEAIRRLIEIGWLEETPEKQAKNAGSHDGAGKSQDGATLSHQGAAKSQTSALNGREGKGTEKNTCTPACVGDSSASDVPLPAPPPPRERNDVWDAIASCWKMNPQTKSEKSRMGKLARDYRIKLDGAPACLEIDRKRVAYRYKFPNAADTPEAVLKHWDTLDEYDPLGPVVYPTAEDLKAIGL